MRNKRINYKEAVAQSTKDLGLIELLSKHKRTNIRKAAAINPLCPRHVLLKLADDPNVSVRQMVAGNNYLCFDEFKYLMDKNDHEINVALSKNPYLPEEFQLQLLNEPWISYPYNMASKAKSSKVIDALIDYQPAFKGHLNNLFMFLASNPNLNFDQLQKIFDFAKNCRNLTHSIDSIMNIIAYRSNPEADKKMLLYLARRYSGAQDFVAKTISAHAYNKLGLANFL